MGMREYVVRRIGQLAVTYWAFITILFILFRIVPGDPTTMFVAQGLSGEARQEVIADLGLNQPLHIQYIDYMTQLLSGSFGRSFIYKAPVTDIIVTKFWNTIFLMMGAILLAYFIGIFGGALLAWRRGTRGESAGVIATLIARSSPTFWTGILLIIVFVFWLDWFPAGGIRTIGADIDGFWDKYLSLDFAYHAFLPMLTGAIYFMATPTLLMRNTMLDVLNADFIEVKKAEGIPSLSILYKHAARNSILPIITIAALVAGKAIGGMLLIEVVFNWPGMGRAMIKSVNYNDYPLAMAAFFLMGSVVIMMNFAADLMYAYLDPRVSYE